MNRIGIGTFVTGVAMLIFGIGPWWLAVGVLVAGLVLIGAAEEEQLSRSKWTSPSPHAAGPHGSRGVTVSNQHTEARKTVDTGSFGDDWLDVVGESFFESTNRKLRKRETGIFTATGLLVREPSNQADQNAIGVHVDGTGQVGYLARDVAASIAGHVDRGGGRHRCGIRYARTAPDRYWSFTVVTDLELLAS